MGSGFLVSAPLLAGIVGNLAVFAMGVLLVLAFLVGGVIRFNIRHFEPIENDGHGPVQDTAFLSRVVLVGAYFISVTYYLQLLAAFVLNAFDVDSQLWARVITTTLLVIIGAIGMWRGLGELGIVEKYAVALNLGMIGALLVALAVYNVKLLVGGDWALPAISSAIDFRDLRVLLGLLIVVRGDVRDQSARNNLLLPPEAWLITAPGCQLRVDRASPIHIPRCGGCGFRSPPSYCL